MIENMYQMNPSSGGSKGPGSAATTAALGEEAFHVSSANQFVEMP